MTERPEANGEEMHKPLADADTAERFITEKHLGERIRRLAPQEVDGSGGAGPPHRPLCQLPLAAWNWPRRADAAQPGAHRYGLLQRPLVLLRVRARSPCFACIAKRTACACRKPAWSRPAYTFESLGYMVPDRSMDPYFAEFVPLPAAG